MSVPDYFIFYISIGKGDGILASCKELTYYLYHQTSEELPKNTKEEIIWRKEVISYTASKNLNLTKYSKNASLSRHIQWNFLAFSINLKFIVPAHDIPIKKISILLMCSNTLKQLVHSLIVISGVIIERVGLALFHRLFINDVLDGVGFI